MDRPDAPQTESQQLVEEINTPAPQSSLWRRAIIASGRFAMWAVLTPPRAGMRAWAQLRPVQQLITGFALYAIIGALILSAPFSQARPTRFIDNAFTATSAISTTGLTTVSVSDHYNALGKLVILALFQTGGIGFMTLSSLLVIARGGRLNETRMGVLRAGFSVPRYFVMQHFLVHIVVFTFSCEAIGAALLWWRFSVAGVDAPLWSAVFHSVSAFATAGFSLHNSSLEQFSHDWIVNLVIASLSYLGAVGFIVAQDLWYTIKLREKLLTFTSKVILLMTASVCILGTLWLGLFEPAIKTLPWDERFLAAFFQTMTASTTAGFNTIPISSISSAGLVVIMLAMLIGASPSGTGGGIKTTSVSAILANLISVLRQRERISWLGHEVPMSRVLYAFAATSLYLFGLCAGVLALCITENRTFLELVFEAASAIGTVGLSLGVTSELTTSGKIVIILLMFVGRCGPLTIGLAMLRPDTTKATLRGDDLAI